MTALGLLRHGGLAQFNVAPARALHKISPDVPVERACLAEPLACVLHAFEKSALLPGESAAILGAGPIGLLFLILFQAAGAANVVIVDPSEFRRSMADRLGAHLPIHPMKEDIPRGT